MIRVYGCVHVFVNNFVISCPIDTKPSAFYRKFRAQHLSRGRRNTRDFEHAKCGEVCHPVHPSITTSMIHFLTSGCIGPLGPYCSNRGSGISAPRRPSDKRSTVPDRGPKKCVDIFFFFFQKSKMAAGRHLEFPTFRPLSPKRLEISSPNFNRKHILMPPDDLQKNSMLNHFRSAILKPKRDVTWPGSSSPGRRASITFGTNVLHRNTFPTSK